MKSIIKTYEPNELKVLTTYEGTATGSAEVRIRIGIENDDKTNDISLLILSNNKMYLTTHLTMNVDLARDEINPKSIATLLRDVQNLKSTIGALSNLITSDRTSIVKAINEVKTIQNLPRTIVGMIDWVVSADDSDIVKFMDDKAIIYHETSKCFYYYSETSEEYIALPQGWQMLNKVYRTVDEAGKNLINDTFIGILSDSKIYKVVNGKLIETKRILNDKAGNEYIVKNVHKEGQYGTLIYDGKKYISISDLV